MSAAVATCGWCNGLATGLAEINGQRFCHGDGDTEPTCYERAQWSRTRAHHPDCPARHFVDHPERCRCLFMAMLDSRPGVTS